MASKFMTPENYESYKSFVSYMDRYITDRFFWVTGIIAVVIALSIAYKFGFEMQFREGDREIRLSDAVKFVILYLYVFQVVLGGRSYISGLHIGFLVLCVVFALLPYLFLLCSDIYCNWDAFCSWLLLCLKRKGKDDGHKN